MCYYLGHWLLSEPISRITHLPKSPKFAPIKAERQTFQKRTEKKRKKKFCELVEMLYFKTNGPHAVQCRKDDECVTVIIAKRFRILFVYWLASGKQRVYLSTVYHKSLITISMTLGKVIKPLPYRPRDWLIILLAVSNAYLRWDASANWFINLMLPVYYNNAI